MMEPIIMKSQSRLKMAEVDSQDDTVPYLMSGGKQQPNNSSIKIFNKTTKLKDQSRSMAKLEQKHFVPNQLHINLQPDPELKYIPSSAVQLHSNHSVSSSQRGQLVGNRKMSYQDNFRPRNHSNHHSNTRLKHN